ncbi:MULTISPECIES: hypothetical protein [Streptomyces]|uniref:hypothetical protein n=1 Tax=Streptomyces TaxID=1883 RepID=UPI000A4CD4C4|nr:MULTISPECIES: hypothetical protein [Streptomyces]
MGDASLPRARIKRFPCRCNSLDAVGARKTPAVADDHMDRTYFLCGDVDFG